MTNKEESINDKNTTIELSVAGMESGVDPDTGESKYKVHFHPTTMSKASYESFMKKQLASSDDTVRVVLE